MISYLFRRLNLLVITGFILTIISFMLTLWSNDTGIERYDYIDHYISYMSDIFNGDWGTSKIDQQPLLEEAMIAFASTLELCFLACITATIIGLPLGVIAGLKRNGLIDYTIMTVALVGLALPVFWLAILFILIPVSLGISIPVDGHLSPIYEIPVVSGFLLIDTIFASDIYHLDAFFDRLAHLILPSSVLSFFLITEIIRLTRHSISHVMECNYIKAAYANGLSKTQIVFRHGLKNALPPILPQIIIQLSTIISFAMAIEIVFSSEGIGVWLYNSITVGDYLVLPVALLIISFFILLSNIAIDILIMIISPIKRKSLYANK
ncbi:MAG: ABC transporter permease subunit [Psychromonas sp.]